MCSVVKVYLASPFDCDDACVDFIQLVMMVEYVVQTRCAPECIAVYIRCSWTFKMHIILFYYYEHVEFFESDLLIPIQSTGGKRMS